MFTRAAMDPRNDMDAGEEDATLFLVFLAIGFVSYIFALYALLIKHYLVGVVVVLGLFAIVALLDTALVIHQRGLRTGEPLGEKLWRWLRFTATIPAMPAMFFHRVISERREEQRFAEFLRQLREKERAKLEPCPICFEPPTHGVQTRCGHVFCGECFFTHWEAQQQALQSYCATPACPYCRTPVLLLRTKYTRLEAMDIYDLDQGQARRACCGAWVKACSRCA